MLNELEKQIAKEKKQALWWESQGQYNTIHHDRIKAYKRQMDDIKKSGRNKDKPEEVNDGS